MYDVFMILFQLYINACKCINVQKAHQTDEFRQNPSCPWTTVL